MGKSISVLGVVALIVLTWFVATACSGDSPERARPVDTTAPPAAAATQPAPAPSSGEEVHRRLIDAINAGDVEATLALFHEDANVWDALGCKPNCHGAPKIREAVQSAAAKHWRFDGASIETLQTTYTTWTASKAELRGDDIAAAGLERVRAGFALAARDGKIASLRGGYDQSDDETRRFLAQTPPSGPINPTPVMTPEGRMVDVGGRRIYMECMGEGNPTVIFEGGSNAVRGAASSRLWAGGAQGQLSHVRIQQDVAQVTRACTYDPAGVALSDPRPRPSTGREDAADMHLLLRSAGFAPPYVVVGISYGGQVAQLFANMYPAETAGVVLLDSTMGWDWYERFAMLLSPEAAERYWASVRQSWDQAKSPQGLAGGTDVETTLTQLREKGPLPDVPLRVLTAGIPLHPWNATAVDVQQREQLRYDTQAALARLAPKGVHQIVDNSEHGMNAFVPELIGDVIKQTVQAARSAQGR